MNQYPNDRNGTQSNKDDQQKNARTQGWNTSGSRSDFDASHSMIIGYLLWLFGFTGSHRFYFGKPISGTIWFFTLGLLGIGWLIDIFLIPSMAKEADQRFEDGDINYTLAWVLLTFLGIFGAHRFYIGHYISGAVMLIITLSTMSLGWLVLPIPFFIGIPILIGFLIYDFWTLNTQIADKHRYSL